MLPDEGKGLTRIALAALALVLALVANVGGAAAQGGGVIIDATGAKRGKRRRSR